jgi:hypothetical protein
MKTEFLKELGLTEEQISKIMAENGKDVEKVKTQAGAEKTRADGLQDQLDEANKQIEGFKGLDVAGIKKAADDWKEKYDQAAKDADAKINALKFDHALEGALSGAKAKNAKAVKALLDMDGLKLNGEEIVGLNEQLEKIKQDNDFLFEEEKAPGRFVASAPGTKVNTDDKNAQANAAFRAVFGKE